MNELKRQVFSMQSQKLKIQYVVVQALSRKAAITSIAKSGSLLITSAQAAKSAAAAARGDITLLRRRRHLCV